MFPHVYVTYIWECTFSHVKQSVLVLGWIVTWQRLFHFILIFVGTPYQRLIVSFNLVYLGSECYLFEVLLSVLEGFTYVPDP